MKLKFIFIAALCFIVPLFAACGNLPADNDGEESSTTENTETITESESESESETEVETETDENAAETPNDESEEIEIMYVIINSNKLEVKLAENSSVDALIEILKQNDITYTADDYGNFEKVGDIGYTLPRNDVQITTEPGDVILYQGTSICLYYGTNTWSFTRIGKITGFTQTQLKELLCAGDGKTEVTLSLD